MPRDPRHDPVFGDELLCQASEKQPVQGYVEHFILRVVACEQWVEVLTRRPTGTYWRHDSLDIGVYREITTGAEVRNA